jgi:predicted kinase
MATPTAPNTPRLILVSGHPASGKTAIGQRLSTITGSAVVDENNRSFHQAAVNHALAGIAAGHSVILVLPLNEQIADTQWIYQLLTQVEKLSADLSYLWVKTDPDTVHHRLSARATANNDPADVALLKRWGNIQQNYAWSPEEWLPDFIFDNGASANPTSDRAFIEYAQSLAGTQKEPHNA